MKDQVGSSENILVIVNRQKYRVDLSLLLTCIQLRRAPPGLSGKPETKVGNTYEDDLKTGRRRADRGYDDFGG